MVPIRPATSALAAVQLLALLTMLIDHLGAVGLLDVWSRLVGRASLPAFVLMVACNALRAADPWPLLSRYLLLFSLSQPVWWLSVGFPDLLCILPTLYVVALLVQLRDCSWYYPALVLGVFLVVSPWIEYGAWPLLLVPVVVWPALWSVLLALSWPFLQYAYSPVYLPFALVGLLLVLSLLVQFSRPGLPRLPRLVTRWFYPVHLYLIKIIT